MKIEEMIDLLEIAAVNVDRFDDIRIYKYQSRARALLFAKTIESVEVVTGSVKDLGTIIVSQ
jgi:hypothetical protein